MRKTTIKKLGMKTRRGLIQFIKDLIGSKRPKDVYERELAKDALKKWYNESSN